MVTQDKLESFVAGVQAISDKYMRENFPRLDPVVITLVPGRRYAKLVRYKKSKDGELYSGSVHCFVDMTNGDVLKAASWKAPAKGARGNIFDDKSGLGRMTPYGAEYNI